MRITVPGYLSALLLAWSCVHFAALGSPQNRSFGRILPRIAVTIAVFGLYQATGLQWCVVIVWAAFTAILDNVLLPHEDVYHTGVLYGLNALAVAGLHAAILAGGVPPTPRLPALTAADTGAIASTVALLILASRAGNHCVRSVVQGAVRPISSEHKDLLMPLYRGQGVSAQAQIAATSDSGATPAPVLSADLRLGRVIGTLERLLIITLVTANSYEALAFVIGTKSLVRYSRLSEPAFAEYFLVGTLTSALIGVALGLGVRALW